jgi:rubrerythrin
VKLKEKTEKNIYRAFIEEAKAHQRLLMFAKKAEEEDLPQIAHLFRAVATAEGIHSRRHFSLLESIADTQSNLERSFQTEEGINTIHYPKMIQEADEEGEQVAVTILSQSRDVEAIHAKLYKNALNNLIAQDLTNYFVCTICGYITERDIPALCPICNASKLKFHEIK